jgi:diaminohydroxyphosphoribosylaminopyrimidine deaminase / 5-amino-6-(5-phosphoribosylamino)uracil reductase
MPERFGAVDAIMRRALALAARGIGSVEPNPPVGAVLVDDELNLIAEGWHQHFGGPHAEVEAIAQAGDRARGATLFVTLEPCCHQGKTGPCTEAIARAGIRKVVVAARDPFPQVDGKGVERLTSLGIEIETGPMSEAADSLIAPFRKLVTKGLPWVHAKWAMTLDGKIATHTGDSRWISNEASRARVHQLRGRMDAIVVGSGTALKDNPLLTARPAGPRTAARIVVDSQARLPLNSQLVGTARSVPLIVAASSAAPPENVRRLKAQGAEVLRLPAWPAAGVDLGALLTELGRRQFTHVLFEGGGRLFGSLFDAGSVDEVHVFVAPKVVGGAGAHSAVGGRGLAQIESAFSLDSIAVEQVGSDVYIRGRRRSP